MDIHKEEAKGGESVANQAKMETDQTEAKTEAATVSPFTATEAESAAAGRYVGEVIHDSDMKARIPGLFTLLRCGCCELCALRFLGQRVFSLYREPLPVLRCIMESLWATLPETERRSDGSDWRARSQATEAAACVACLGTLQNVQSDKFMGPLLAALTGGTGKYEFSDYSLTITMPASTVTRQYALHYHLLATHKFTEEFEDKSTIVDIKEAMKWILGHELRRRIGLNFSREYISPHFITLDLTTQAGTYVKEFVHGDLGRTTPNLGLLLGCETDILQLDVLAIELDFPPRLPGQPPIEDVFASTAEKEKQPADETVTTEEGEQQKRKEADKPKEASV
ncbi:uncharacterized protein ACA1_275560 [Acanthamoeba castellanii str. Neff]|uniref:tRNA pseudouridine(55) synthase n=1 Tax=Acanthamoeba castellanii (strain ATCC 30010 / Neff) TaxID=1257118 RepID=L8GR17_ACACF|nr:uncharacterized protein ACA1_275560 [Acanthamoeba castellanii str. Neff]ELR15382.1 hypothetical protein ACA1_275560 [Acanthamoeba castellanii str. Neff]